MTVSVDSVIDTLCSFPYATGIYELVGKNIVSMINKLSKQKDGSSCVRLLIIGLGME